MQIITLRPWLFLFSLVLAFAVYPASRSVAQAGDIWLSVDTSALTLSVMQGDSTLKVYTNIAIGSNGVTRQKRVKDEKTPLGDFRINGIDTSQRFRLFLSIDYPNMRDVQKAFDEGRIDAAEYEALRQAWRRSRPPPQNTSLGGNLGIHGIGAGSMEIHNSFNWTNGCIALTNDQVEELAAQVRIGTRVRIH